MAVPILSLFGGSTVYSIYIVCTQHFALIVVWCSMEGSCPCEPMLDALHYSSNRQRFSPCTQVNHTPSTHFHSWCTYVYSPLGLGVGSQCCFISPPVRGSPLALRSTTHPAHTFTHGERIFTSEGGGRITMLLH